MWPKTRKITNEDDDVVTMGVLKQLIEQQFAQQTEQLSKDLHQKNYELENDLLAAKAIADNALQIANSNESRIAALKSENDQLKRQLGEIKNEKLVNKSTNKSTV